VPLRALSLYIIYSKFWPGTMRARCCECVNYVPLGTSPEYQKTTVPAHDLRESLGIKFSTCIWIYVLLCGQTGVTDSSFVHATHISRTIPATIMCLWKLDFVFLFYVYDVRSRTEQINHTIVSGFWQFEKIRCYMNQNCCCGRFFLDPQRAIWPCVTAGKLFLQQWS
jgi:hypothetical protein